MKTRMFGLDHVYRTEPPLTMNNSLPVLLVRLGMPWSHRRRPRQGGTCFRYSIGVNVVSSFHWTGLEQLQGDEKPRTFWHDEMTNAMCYFAMIPPASTLLPVAACRCTNHSFRFDAVGFGIAAAVWAALVEFFAHLGIKMTNAGRPES